MKRKKSVLYLQSIFLVFFMIYIYLPLASADPLKSFGSFQYNIWTNDNGLPMNTVTAINQAADGYIWLGTEAGIARFDGIDFETFNFDNTPLLSSTIIVDIMVDRKGTVWIITQRGGIILFKNKTFESYSKYADVLSNEIWSVMESADESIWIGSKTGLHHIERETITSVPLPDRLSTKVVRMLLEDREGRVWVGMRGDGLVLVKKRGDDFISEYMGLEGMDIISLMEDHKGGLWAGTMDNGIHRFWGGPIISFSSANGLESNTAYDLHEDRFGNIWIATEGGGVNILSPNSTTTGSEEYIIAKFPRPEAFTCDVIYDFFKDREGTLWMGTNGGGLYNLREAKITTFTTKNGLSYNNVYGVLQDSKGKVWVGTKGYGINYYDSSKNRFFTLTTDDGLSSNSITCFTEDPFGALWFGTLGGGVNRLKDGKVQVYVERHGLLDTNLRSIYCDPGGNIWAGSIKGGIYRFERDRFLKQSDMGIRINMLKKDSRGFLWACTLGGGLIRLDLKNNSKTIFKEEDGLSNNIVSCIHEDETEKGTFWIGTLKGLNRLKKDTFSTLYRTDGLPDDTSYWILEDQKHDFWISSNQGIYCLGRKDADDFFDGNSTRVCPSVYGKEAGMHSVECNGGNQPAGYKTKDGKLWFPTTNGVSVIDPIDIGINKVPPPVVIKKVMIDGEEYPLGNLLNIPPGKNNIEIHYTAPSFIVPEKIRFKYKMEGLNSEWVNTENKRRAYFTDLAPGTYSFQVIACNSDGVWNNTGTGIELHLKSRFFQRPIFIIVFLLLLIFSALFLYCFNKKCNLHPKEKQKNRPSNLGFKESNRYIDKLRHIMEVEKVYRDPNLTIKTLASKLVISSRTLSQIINDQLETNFYEFVNQQRIKEAQQLLNSPDSQQRPILEIAYDVGYNSKSAFNRAFKHFTGMTPSEFRKKGNG